MIISVMMCMSARENTLYLLQQQKAVGTRATGARTIVDRLVGGILDIVSSDFIFPALIMPLFVLFSDLCDMGDVMIVGP